MLDGVVKMDVLNFAFEVVEDIGAGGSGNPSKKLKAFNESDDAKVGS